MRIEIEARLGNARAGTLQVRGLRVPTPLFMPVGTYGSVKAMAPDEVWGDGTRVVLANTFHLLQRPGLEVLERLGGLHRFMGWDGAILTDSGGYQVFSLAERRAVDEDGVSFASPLDGSRVRLTPASVVEAQGKIGSDIAMVLDECTPFPATHEQARKSLRLTLEWARQCREQPRTPGQMVFGIVQGGLHRDLRVQSAVELRGMDFDGLALGGLSVGEPEADMYTVLDWTVPELPADKPRYLMGVGTPAQVVRAVARGIDMFDCVLPTRVGRNGSAYTATGAVPIKAGRFKADSGPIEEGCACYACRTFSRAYIRHLLNVDEILGLRLMTVHNLTFYLTLMARIRDHIENGTFRAFHDEFLARYEGE